ncbi:hypothetical protein [Saccharicrinis aurantiacus]|uniref:hypothetical protein n=1 Tax=Saccharicrinis aurantiacus TaxID=1849719 RepID=UPI00094FF2A8|nr:hypothetical protein [Saccharicrinis aurantiacus]
MKILITLLFITVCISGVFAQTEQKSADEIARELSNPVSALGSLIFQGNYAQWGGSAQDVTSQNTSTLTFLPTLPVSLKTGNLIFRPIVPVSAGLTVDQYGNWQKKRGLGDLGLMAMYGYIFKSGIVLGGGPNFLFPTATDEAIGSGQFQVGPSAVFAFIRKWGVFGGLWQHYYGVGHGDDNVNLGTFQAFYWFGIGNGWQVGGSPTLTANYVNAIDTDFSVPVNLGLAKTVIVGKMPLKLTLQGQYFVTRPDYAGQSWGVFFQITPVIKLPWG